METYCHVTVTTVWLKYLSYLLSNHPPLLFRKKRKRYSEITKMITQKKPGYRVLHSTISFDIHGILAPAFWNQDTMFTCTNTKTGYLYSHSKLIEEFSQSTFYLKLCRTEFFFNQAFRKVSPLNANFCYTRSNLLNPIHPIKLKYFYSTNSFFLLCCIWPLYTHNYNELICRTLQVFTCYKCWLHLALSQCWEGQWSNTVHNLRNKRILLMYIWIQCSWQISSDYSGPGPSRRVRSSPGNRR